MKTDDTHVIHSSVLTVPRDLKSLTKVDDEAAVSQHLDVHVGISVLTTMIGDYVGFPCQGTNLRDTCNDSIGCGKANDRVGRSRENPSGQSINSGRVDKLNLHPFLHKRICTLVCKLRTFKQITTPAG